MSLAVSECTPSGCQKNKDCKVTSIELLWQSVALYYLLLFLIV